MQSTAKAKAITQSSCNPCGAVYLTPVLVYSNSKFSISLPMGSSGKYTSLFCTLITNPSINCCLLCDVNLNPLIRGWLRCNCSTIGSPTPVESTNAGITPINVVIFANVCDQSAWNRSTYDTQLFASKQLSPYNPNTSPNPHPKQQHFCWLLACNNYGLHQSRKGLSCHRLVLPNRVR